MWLVQRTQWQMLMYHSCVSLSAPCERNVIHKTSVRLALAYTHPCPVLLCVSQVKPKVGKAVRVVSTDIIGVGTLFSDVD